MHRGHKAKVPGKRAIVGCKTAWWRQKTFTKASAQNLNRKHLAKYRSLVERQSKTQRRDPWVKQEKVSRQASGQESGAKQEDRTRHKLQEQNKQQDRTRHKLHLKTQGTSQDKTAIKASGQESRTKQEDRTRHKPQDRTSSKTGQDISSFKTRPKQDQAGKMYGMPSSGPSSSLSGTHSPVYGENVDYAIRIVEHFINFLPSSSGKLF